MIRKMTIVVGVVLSMLVNEAMAQCSINSRIQNISAPVSSRITNFLEYLPLNYNSTSTNYPVIINWSGSVQIGGSFCDLLSNGLPKVLNDGVFPETVSDGVNSFSYIVISPQINYFYTGPQVDNVAEANAMINYLLTYYRIDPQRIYMTGFSWGSFLIMDHATSSPANAQKIAALISVANCYQSNQGDYNTRVSNLVNADVELWGLSCTNDPTCTTTWIQDWVNSVNSGNPGSAQFNSVCNNSHYAWDLVYPPSYSSGGKNLYQWMIQYTSNFALPAVIKNYSVRMEQGKVYMEWTTTAESNTDHFILEKAGADMNFSAVNMVSALGNSNTGKKYLLVDDQPQRGPNFYRLVLVNRDSKKEYYAIKKISLPGKFNGHVSIPNPIRNLLTVYLDIPTKQVITIGLYDLNGKLISRSQKLYAPGISQSAIDVSGMAKGTYIIHVNGDNIASSHKVMIN